MHRNTFIQSHLDLQYHKYGNRVGKLVALLCRGPHTPTPISSPKDAQGNRTSTPRDTNLILCQTIWSRSHKGSAEDFLDQVSLPKVDHSHLTQLNSPVTAQEVTKAISSLASGKAPGPDSYISEFYKLSANSYPSIGLPWNSRGRTIPHVWLPGLH